ncbi:MAG: tRNA pseudouridine(13) synthase TruD [Acidobacteriota bacterium]
MPRIREIPEDFVVEELPAFEPSGEGPFAWLWVEKRLANTDEVAGQLARALGLAAKHVGWAGRKDRRAVTRQWFSVPAADADIARLELVDAEILRSTRHHHRLRPGDLRGNRFVLRVRDLDAAQAKAAALRLDGVLARGLPNRFGPQRYGRDGRNAERGLAILRAERAVGERRRARLMLSALQSAVFDRVLAARLDTLDAVWDGDVVEVHATGEQRWARGDADDQDRAERFDVSPTGLIFGTKVKATRGPMREIEEAAMRAEGLDPRTIEPPRGLRLPGARRPLRVRPSNASLQLDPSGASATLHVDLPAGVYATTLLAQLFPDGIDEGPSGTD